MARRPRYELDVLAKTAREQLQRAEALGKSLDRRLKAKREAADDWVPDEDFRRDFASINAVIQHGGTALIRAIEHNKKNFGELTEDQLEAQFDAELVRSAQTMPDEQWQMMVAARAKKAQP